MSKECTEFTNLTTNHSADEQDYHIRNCPDCQSHLNFDKNLSKLAKEEKFNLSSGCLREILTEVEKQAVTNQPNSIGFYDWKFLLGSATLLITITLLVINQFPASDPPINTSVPIVKSILAWDQSITGRVTLRSQMTSYKQRHPFKKKTSKVKSNNKPGRPSYYKRIQRLNANS